MGALAFFLSAAVITLVSFTVSEFLQHRRRGLRRAFTDARGLQTDADFAVSLSALAPVPANFARAFRLAAGRALGVEPALLRADDRLGGDLHVLNFDAIELAALLERAFDVRVRVLDIVRSRTLRDLCRLMHERAENISEADPPLHRDPVPRIAQPEPTAVPPGQP